VSAGGMLSVLRRGKTKAAEPDGCDPAVFAEQIASYLERAAQERPGPVMPGIGINITDVADIAHGALSELAAAPQPSYESPSLNYESPSLRAIAAVAVEHANVTIEDAVNQEWLETLPAEPVEQREIFDAVEPSTAATPDESVSFALEEAVRHLFADSAPAVDAAPETAAPAEIFPQAATVAARSRETVAAKSRETVAAKSTEKDEWVAVDELIASLQLMPLAAIEITTDDEWMAPVLDEPQRAADRPDQFADDSSLAPVAAKSEREWVALIESLRHDVERLRVERGEKPGRKAAAGAARPDKTDKTDRTDRPAKPVQDEWGFFDPQQCGFAALLAKLDEVTDSEDGQINQ
jgi:hypothetical protein